MGVDEDAFDVEDFDITSEEMLAAVKQLEAEGYVRVVHWPDDADRELRLVILRDADGAFTERGRKEAN